MPDTFYKDLQKAINNKTCMECGKSIPGYEPHYCCNGHECGCYGLPMEPPVCDECWDNKYKRGEQK